MRWDETLEKYVSTNKQTINNSMEKKYPDWIENCLPNMTPQQQKQMLHQLVKEANEDSRKQAISDPLSRIAMA